MLSFSNKLSLSVSEYAGLDSTTPTYAKTNYGTDRRRSNGLSAADRSAYAKWGKRLFDLSIGTLLFVIALPIMLVLFVVVSIDGGSPVFGHKRVGRNGRVFKCYKIRTMVMDAEARLQALLASDPEAAAEWAQDFKLRKDPRITTLGRYLRKTSLDELPQIWNVLTGEMSLIGPRPVTQDELKLYGSSAETYKSVRPGLTGRWQVSGRNEVIYDERVKLDDVYATNLSLADDLIILLLTPLAVFRVTGV